MRFSFMFILVSLLISCSREIREPMPVKKKQKITQEKPLKATKPKPENIGQITARALLWHVQKNDFSTKWEDQRSNSIAKLRKIELLKRECSVLKKDRIGIKVRLLSGRYKGRVCWVEVAKTSFQKSYDAKRNVIRNDREDKKVYTAFNQSIVAQEDFVVQHPENLYVLQAKERKTSLIKERDHKIFQSYMQKNNIVAYEEFLKKYPENIFKDEAIKRKELLLIEKDYKVYIKHKDPQMDAFTKTYPDDLEKSMELYKEFVELHPKNRFVADAKKRIKELREATKFQERYGLPISLGLLGGKDLRVVDIIEIAHKDISNDYLLPRIKRSSSKFKKFSIKEIVLLKKSGLNEKTIAAMEDKGKNLLTAKVEFTNELVVPKLIASLKDKKKSVIKAAMASLAQIGPKAKVAAPALFSALSDKDLRAEAATALEKIGSTAVPFFIKALQSKDKDIRLLAIEKLSGMGIVALPAISQLCTALADQEENIRIAAATTLGKITALYQD